ncbi:MAG: hypothetical protein GF417_03910 [Candidatus Latescibacteria bacterium]|nr:hypothetical protein [bacterium]MBD3423571.1 hypothetical protein [Candidatus Latescibacterota bacterium]
MKYRLIITAAAVILLAVTALPGCEKAPEDPARRAMYYSVRALGGLERTTGWSTRVQKGVLKTYFPGWGNLKADYTVHVKKPDRIRMDQNFSAYDHPFYYTYYGNGPDVWAVVNLNVRQHQRYTSMVTEALERVDGLPYYYSNCDTFFLSGEEPSDSLVSGYQLQRVGCVLEGDTILFDLDAETRFPVRRIEPGSDRQELMEDYREVDGIMVPYKLTRYQSGRERNSVQWKEISYGVRIPDSLFLEFKPDTGS